MQQPTSLAAAPMPDPKWTIANPPPEGDKDVAAWAWQMFELAREERDRLGLPERWSTNYQLYRGTHSLQRMKNANNVVELNLFFANVERTKANITARNPQFEVVSLSGDDPDQNDRKLTASGTKWWKDSRQKRKLSTTVLQMEIYGITIEKPFWNTEKKRPDVAVIDPFAFFPAPGYYDDISLDAPYVCHAYPETVEVVEEAYGVDGILPSDVYSILGENREDDRPAMVRQQQIANPSAHYDNRASLVRHDFSDRNFRERRALVVEVWVRDYTTEKVEEIVAEDEETGAIVTAEVERMKYPGGIRCITVTNNGQKLLADMPNPNINPHIDREHAQNSFLFWRFPFALGTSYEDPTTIWGFSAAEQVGDLNLKIDQVFSRMFGWASRVMFPPLIIPQDSGIPRSSVTAKPNLVLEPKNSTVAQAIRFVDVPNVPQQLFNFFDMFVQLYDRIYQIEDADRGEAPTGVIAAAAIMALQERNAVLIQKKISAVDELVEFRGQAFVSMLQQFSIQTEAVEVAGEIGQFRGTDLRDREFNFVVESGSTMPRTSLQLRADAEKAYQLGAIDRQAYLEAIEFPRAQEIIERVGEGQMGQAIQLLVQAGLPEEPPGDGSIYDLFNAQVLQQVLQETQGGPGNRPQNPQKARQSEAGQGRQREEMTESAKAGQEMTAGV
jgi:hypothetical protein